MRTIAEAQGVKVDHISFHAAIGNALNNNPLLTARLMQTLKNIDSELIVFGMEKTVIIEQAAQAGLHRLLLFLADRAYTKHGKLVPRGQDGAVIHDETTLRKRVRRFLENGTIETIEGNVIPIKAQSILVHSDTPGALELAAIIHSETAASGATIAPARTIILQRQ